METFRFKQVDVSKEASVGNLAEQTLSRFGRVDILVNDAGIYLQSSVVERRLGSGHRRCQCHLSRPHGHDAAPRTPNRGEASSTAQK